MRVGYDHFISNKVEWNNCFIKFSNRVLPPIFISTILQSGQKSIQRPVICARDHLIITSLNELNEIWRVHNTKLWSTVDENQP